MGVNIQIRRQDYPDSEPYEQNFSYDGNLNITIANFLNKLNLQDELIDVDGEFATRVSWDCSCIQKKCGACSMVINGKPSLACDVFLCDIAQDGDTITVAPLDKFPIIRDLRVDRSIIFEELKKLQIWVEQKAVLNPETHELQYQSARCLHCGCCLQANEKYEYGNSYYGTMGVVAASRLIEQNEGHPHAKEVAEQINEHFYELYDYNAVPRKVCPLDLPIKDLRINTKAKVDALLK